MIGAPGYRLLVSHALAATAMAMPWPVLLADVWAATGSDLVLGLTGGARMLPYVLLSAAAGILADRFRRTRVLRWSTAGRAASLVGCGIALTADRPIVAVAFAVLTVAIGTPAYPAAVAAMPRLAGARTTRLTSLLVTAEVSAFVVGPALGGLLLGAGVGTWSVAAAIAATAGAWVLLLGLDSGAPVAATSEARRGRLRTVVGSQGVLAAMVLIAAVNFVESFVSVGLLGLSHQEWGAGDRGFGIATAALGFGSLAAPLLLVVIRLRGALVLTGAGFAAAGIAPGTAVAAGPLVLAGAAGTAVECAGTEVLQRSVPDHVRAFSLGLADSVMVLAAMVGALVAPRLVSIVGAPVMFVAWGAVLVLAALAIWRRRDLSAPASADQPVSADQAVAVSAVPVAEASGRRPADPPRTG